MRSVLLSAYTLIVAIAFGGCGKPDPVDIVDDGTDLMVEYYEILKTVDDEASAKKAVKKLDKLADKLEKLSKKAEGMEDPTPEEREKIEAILEEKLLPLIAEMVAVERKMVAKPEIEKILQPVRKRIDLKYSSERDSAIFW